MQNLTKKWKQPPAVILRQAINYNNSVPEDPLKLFISRIFFGRYFLTISIMVTEQL